MTSGVKASPEEMKALKTKVLDYFTKTPGGTFAAACKAAGLPYSTGYDWRRDDVEFDAAVIAARKAADDLGGDFAESKLMEAIKNNELTGIIFYLKTKHKSRGYVERVEQQAEISGRNGGPIVNAVSVSDAEILAQYMKDKL